MKINELIDNSGQSMENKTLLYHYSSERYDILKTKRLTTSFTDDELKGIEKETKQFNTISDYIDHISLLFDPIPSKLLPTIFPDDHHIWFKDSVVYEYIVDIDDIERPFAYEVAESPEDVRQIDNTDWTNDSVEFTAKYTRKQQKRKRKTGEVGTDFNTFLKQVNKYKGTTEAAYEKAPTSKDWNLNLYKYAATVPHIMIYPKNGLIKFRSINKVIIGSDNRTEIFRGY